MTLMSRALCALAALACPTLAAGFLSDPVVTHTNGMRLASTTADRSHNVYWRCDPNHLGYCEGRLYSPCRNDWRSFGTRPGGQFAPPCTPRGAVGGQAVHFPDGLEHGAAEQLGTLPAESPEGGRVAAAGGAIAPGTLGVGTPPAAAPTTAGPGGVWIDALQTLGRKVMATPPDDGA